MATITPLVGSDGITTANSMTKINENLANLNADKMETSVLDTDTALTANSDAKVATQKAVKAYVDAGGNVNASTTTKGIVEEATQAEVDAGTAAGGTGARLFVNPSTLNKSRKIYVDYSTTEIANNTAVETNIFSQTVTGGLLGTNNVIRFKIYVSNFSVDSDAASDPVFRFKYGATTLATATFTQGDGNPMSGWIEGALFASGATGTQKGTMTSHFWTDRNTASGALSTNAIWDIREGTATEDSTADKTLAVSIQWGSAQIVSDFVPAGVIIELVA
jgi:hypothetical protein